MAPLDIGLVPSFFGVDETTGAVIWPYFCGRGHLLLANGADLLRAAGVEGAPFGQGVRAGDVALNRLNVSAFARQAGDGLQQGCGIGMRRAVENRSYWPFFDDPPHVHHIDVFDCVVRSHLDRG